MRPIHKQDCPLCSSPAEYQLVDFDHRKHFRCPTCIEFAISLDAEECLSTSIPQWRTRYSESAMKSDTERVLSIFIPSDPRQEGVSNPATRGEYALRSTLLR